MNKTIFFTVLCTVILSSAYAEQMHIKDPVYPTFTKADTLHGTLTPSRTCYDVRFYDISVDVFPETKYIVGDVSFDFLYVDSSQTVMQIDLSSKLDISDIMIDSIRIDGYTREYNAVFVKLPEHFSVENEHRLTCRYRGNPIEAIRPPWEGGFVWKTSTSGKPWCGVTCETLGASCWLPCKDHLSDEPERGMKMRISSPAGLTVVSNGLLLSHETSKDNREIWTWQTNYTINSYNMTFYIGDFIHFDEVYCGIEETFPLDYYVFAEDEEKARKSFEQTKDIIAFYESIYGAYPWSKEGYKLIESPYEGMEHQTAIAYGNGFKNFNIFPMDYIIVHETAHEWWGNAISVDDYAEIFMHEGFAMYSEFLYVEHLLGIDARDLYVKFWTQLIRNIRPVVGPRDVNYWDYHDIDPYVKGACTLHGLRYIMNNDSLFFEMIRTYWQSRKYTIVTVQDFLDYVIKISGIDYNWYFKQYLYTATPPVLEYAELSKNDLKKLGDTKIYWIADTLQSKTEEIHYVYWRWTHVDDDFILPIPILHKMTQTESRIPVSNKGVIIAVDFNMHSFTRVSNNLFYCQFKKIKKIKNK